MQNKKKNMAHKKNRFDRFEVINNKKFYLINAIIILFVIVVLIASVILFYITVDDTDHKYKNDVETVSNNFNINVNKKNIGLYNFDNWNKDCEWNLIVINNQNEVPEDFGVKLGKYKGKEIDYRIINDLINMIDDAYKDNIKLWISSAYRDVKLQYKLFSEEVVSFEEEGYSNFEAQKLAEKNVARARRSEHQTGLAIDFNGVRNDFCDTKEYEWLIKNSFNYGFILRYPENKKEITGVNFEPWHFRYVGKSVAQEIKEKDICLEEYVEKIIENR